MKEYIFSDRQYRVCHACDRHINYCECNKEEDEEVEERKTLLSIHEEEREW